MFARLIAFLLAVVLFWSGFPVQEQVASFASPLVEQSESALMSAHPDTDGSFTDPHPDDDHPAQALAESPIDLPGLLLASLHVQAHSLLMVQPKARPVGALQPPYLETPQHPPRVTARLA
jgi:hypothetical protein